MQNMKNFHSHSKNDYINETKIQEIHKGQINRDDGLYETLRRSTPGGDRNFSTKCRMIVVHLPVTMSVLY